MKEKIIIRKKYYERKKELKKKKIEEELLEYIKLNSVDVSKENKINNEIKLMKYHKQLSKNLVISKIEEELVDFHIKIDDVLIEIENFIAVEKEEIKLDKCLIKLDSILDKIKELIEEITEENLKESNEKLWDLKIEYQRYGFDIEDFKNNEVELYENIKKIRKMIKIYNIYNIFSEKELNYLQNKYISIIEESKIIKLIKIFNKKEEIADSFNSIEDHMGFVELKAKILEQHSKQKAEPSLKSFFAIYSNFVKQKPNKKPRIPMKILNWTKLDFKDIKGTIWEYMDDTILESIIPEEFAIIFAKESIKEMPFMPLSPFKLVLKNNEKKCFSEPDRQKNIETVLEKTKKKSIDISDALLSYDESILTRDICDLLYPILPEEDEFDKINKATENMDNEDEYSQCDLFIILVGSIKYKIERLDAIEFKNNYLKKCIEILKKIKTFTKGFDFIKNNKKFHKFLKIILAHGNYLYGEKHSVEAFGFYLESLNII